jgi:hypothetical protein
MRMDPTRKSMPRAHCLRWKAIPWACMTIWLGIAALPENGQSAESVLLGDLITDPNLSSRKSELPETSPIATQADPSATRVEPWRQPLDGRRVACLSACQWWPARALRHRASTVRQIYQTAQPRMQQTANWLACFLELQAAHQEDLGAASALRAYYSRIGLYEQQALIEAGRKAVDLQQSKQQRLADRGLGVGFDFSSLERKRLDLQEQQLEVDYSDRQLRELLCSLSGLDYQVSQMEVEPLLIQAAQLDREALSAIAIRDRFDLQAWRYLRSRIDPDSAPMAAGILGPAVGGFGLPLTSLGKLKQLLHQSMDPSTLAESLRRELAALSQAQEEQVRQSVHERSNELQLAYERHRIELQRMASWENRLAQLERLKELGKSSAEEKAEVEAGLLNSRSLETARRLEAKLAEVDLAEAVGGLAGRCCRGDPWLQTGW